MPSMTRPNYEIYLSEPERDPAETGMPEQSIQGGNGAEGEGRQKTDIPIESILEFSGVNALTETAGIEKIVCAAKLYATKAKDFDRVTRAGARSELLKKIKQIKLPDANNFVKELFHTPKAATTRKEIELPFQNPEPWPSPVDGAELLDDLLQTFNRFLILPEHADIALSLWVLFAWTHDAFHISPLLDFRSPTKRCGKSTGLRVLSRLVPRPLPAANISTAALFRSIEKYKPTLLIDEVDTFLKNNDEIQGVLNAGHERDSAFVLRVEGDQHEVKTFNVWGPKILSGIGRRRDTLEDRSITISMKRKAPNEKVEKLRWTPDTQDLFDYLQQKAARWSKDNIDELRTVDPKIPDVLNDRAADNWTPLITIADLCGGDLPDHARKAAVALSGDGNQDDNSAGIMLLEDACSYFRQNKGDRMASEDFVQYLVEIEDRPWPEWRHGKPISKTGVARLLRPFGIKPKVIRIGERTPSGYLKEVFTETFSRYLPDTPPQSSTSSTRLNNKELLENQNSTQDANVELGKQNNLFKNNDVEDVEDEPPPLVGKKMKIRNPAEFSTEELDFFIQGAAAFEEDGVPVLEAVVNSLKRTELYAERDPGVFRRDH